MAKKSFFKNLMEKIDKKMKNMASKSSCSCCGTKKKGKGKC